VTREIDQPGPETLIVAWRDGAIDARDRLIARIHPALEQIAAARLRGETNASLSTGDLVNEAVMQIMAADGADVRDRAHFIALSSRIMRNILVDRARRRVAAKRRHVKVELTTRVEGEQRFDLHALDSALIRLGAIEPALVELIEMRYFGGMSVPDVALATGWSEATVKRRWQVARAWLTDALLNPIDL
jgi:RNA polymerase sigma factor (TIGR02999 family)